jgi:hypothetical protein
LGEGFDGWTRHARRLSQLEVGAKSLLSEGLSILRWKLPEGALVIGGCVQIQIKRGMIDLAQGDRLWEAVEEFLQMGGCCTGQAMKDGCRQDDRMSSMPAAARLGDEVWVLRGEVQEQAQNRYREVWLITQHEGPMG